MCEIGAECSSEESPFESCCVSFFFSACVGFLGVAFFVAFVSLVLSLGTGFCAIFRGSYFVSLGLVSVVFKVALVAGAAWVFLVSAFLLSFLEAGLAALSFALVDLLLSLS